MSIKRIHKLPNTIYNKIAAGEVVERPSSVVKELVENSIDAGATIINISISGGGMDKIQVSDNGSGIHNEDVELAFTEHATSKIASEDDLFGIKTLGFRGEALASIASVSVMSLKTKTADNEIGIQIDIKGGEIVNKSPVVQNTGTTVTVNNLFYNIPARLKFLKKPHTEGSAITTLISRFILAHPHISFIYTSDDATVYSSSGKGFEESFFCIYGSKVLNDCIFVDNTRQNIRVYGYISTPTLTRHNRSYQTQIINNRIASSQTISTAVNNAYSTYLIKHTFPIYALNIEIDYEAVDVNVHPSKLEVRFSNSQSVYDAVYHTVASALHNHTLNSQNNSFDDTNSVFEFAQDIFPVKRRTDFDSDNDNRQIEQFIPNITLNPVYSNKVLLENAFTELNQQSIDIPLRLDVNILGSIFDTYLVLQRGDKVFFIDQHAAHERLIYNSLKNAHDNNDIVVQPLLAPYVLNLNSFECTLLDENLQSLNELGFEIQPFGNMTYIVNTVPSLLGQLNMQQFFGSILKDGALDGGKDTINEQIIRRACRSAIKAGDTLNQDQIEWLFSQLSATATPLTCPHGRPIILELSHSDIEKMFKRIV